MGVRMRSPGIVCFLTWLVAQTGYTEGGDPSFELLSPSLAYKFTGPNSSHFGYSVAFHSLSDSVNDSRILVGAPRGDIDASRVQNRTRRGVVIQCPSTRASIIAKSSCGTNVACAQQLDKTTCVNVRNDAYYSTDTSQTTDAEYGNLVRADRLGSRRVLICAHKSRFTISSALNLSSVGSCYTLDRALTGSIASTVTINQTDQQWNENMYKLVGPSQQSIGQSAALVNDAAIFGDPMSLRRYYYEDMLDRFDPKQVESDPNTMRAIYGLQFMMQAGMVAYKKATGQPYQFWDVYSKRQLSFGESFSHAYLGFSTAAMYYPGDAPKHLIVTGAPRFGARKSGAVFGFAPRFDSNSSESDVFFDQGATGPLKLMYADGVVPLVLQTGSSFGQSVAIADVNGDRIPDILIGAPHHISGPQRGGGGVYIYCGVATAGKIGFRHSLVHIIYGSTVLSEAECAKMKTCELSQFGYAIQSLGDIDQDNLEDFAVSAPFQEGGGAVYVFRGSKSMCLPLAKGKTVDDFKPQLYERFQLSGLQSSDSFGASLDFGTDVDGNGFPDMIVGAPLQNAAYVLLSMPLLKVSASAEATSPLISLEDIPVRTPSSGYGCDQSVFTGKVEQDIEHYLSWSRSTCFTVKVCFTAQIQLPKNVKLQTPLKPAAINVSYQLRLDDNPRSPFISLITSGPAMSGQTPIIRKHTEWLWVSFDNLAPSSSDQVYTKCVDNYIALGINASAGMSMNGTLSINNKKFFGVFVNYTTSMIQPPTDPTNSMSKLQDGQYFRIAQKHQSLPRPYLIPLEYLCANPPCKCVMVIKSLKIPLAESNNNTEKTRFSLNLMGAREKARFTLQLSLQNVGTEKAALPVFFIALLVPPAALLNTVLPSVTGNTVCGRVEQKIIIAGGRMSGEDLSDVELAARNEPVAEMTYLYAKEYVSQFVKTLGRVASTNDIYTVFRCELNVSSLNPSQVVDVEVDVPMNISAHQIGPISARVETAGVCASNNVDTSYARDFTVEFRYKADWNVTMIGSNADSAIAFDKQLTLGASTMKHFEEIGIPLKQTVYVRNQGPSASPSTNLIINVPVEMQCAFRSPQYEPYNRCESLLYLASLPVVQTGSHPMQCSVMMDGRSVRESDYINHFNFSAMARRKRSVDENDAAELGPLADMSTSSSTTTDTKWGKLSTTHRLVYFDEKTGVALVGCKLGDFYLKKTSATYKKQFGALAQPGSEASASCLQLSCPIPMLEPDNLAQIDLTLYLWNSTFIRYLVSSNIRQTRVITTAYLQPNASNLRYMFTNIQPRENDYTYFTLTTIPGSALLKPDDTLPYLLIIGSALGALAFLGVFIIILLRYGVLTPKKYSKAEYEELALADALDGQHLQRGQNDIPNLVMDSSQDELDAEGSSEEIEPFVTGENLAWQSIQSASGNGRGARNPASNNDEGIAMRGGEQFELVQPRLPATRDSNVNWAAPMPTPGSQRSAQPQAQPRSHKNPNQSQRADFAYLRESAD